MTLPPTASGAGHDRGRALVSGDGRGVVEGEQVPRQVVAHGHVVLVFVPGVEGICGQGPGSRARKVLRLVGRTNYALNLVVRHIIILSTGGKTGPRGSGAFPGPLCNHPLEPYVLAPRLVTRPCCELALGRAVGLDHPVGVIISLAPKVINSQGCSRIWPNFKTLIRIFSQNYAGQLANSGPTL